MISFRFHLVSLSAIFLALALGIVLGATVVDQATVNGLENRIKAVRQDANNANNALDVWNRFGSQAENAIVGGRLNGVRVLLVVPEGLSHDVIDKVHSVFGTAGVIDAGTLTLDDAWADTSPKTRSDIAGALGIVGPISLNAIVSEAAARIAQDFAAGGGATLPALANVNMVQISAGDLATTPGVGTRVMVIDDGPAAGLLEPLSRTLATALPARVLMADAGPDDQISDSLVGVLRDDPKDARFSTVDHLRNVEGRIAAVLALRDFEHGGVGDYGSGPGADLATPPSGG